MKNSASAPKHLTPEARRWWRQLAGEYEIEDEAGLLLLGVAMEAFDRLRQAQEILAKEGLIEKDRFGQKRPHPAGVIERDARTAFLRALKQLNLDVELPGPVGRPPGRR